MSTQLVTLDSNQLFSYHFSVFVVAFARGTVLALSMTSSVVEWICPFSGSLGNNQVFCCIRQPFKDWKETELGVSESSLQSQRIVESFAFSHSVSPHPVCRRTAGSRKGCIIFDAMMAQRSLCHLHPRHRRLHIRTLW